MSFMTPIYVSLVNKGKKTIDDVPENIREEVKEALAEKKGTQA